MPPELITTELAEKIKKLPQKGNVTLIAIDGRCASGKSTLARSLAETFNCNVFHMDDFFLRPEQRTPERYAEPGGNVDRERFRSEVLEPLAKGEAFSYRPFVCHEMALGEPVDVMPCGLAVVEGTYSCHPELWDAYALRVFLTTSPEEQISRIKKRNGEMYRMFESKWIPLEERYFAAFSVMEKCDVRYIT